MMDTEERAETPPKLDENITPLMETPIRRDINADPLRPEINVMECIRDLRNTPPPYWCPVENCRREYQSLCGLQYHLQKINHKSAAIIKKSPFGGRRRGHHRTPVHNRVQKAPEVLPTPTRESLTYAEAQRMVEFDLDGCAVRVSIFDPIQIVDITGMMDVPEPISEDKDAVVPSIDVKPENKVQLNEPMFQEIDSYEISDAPPMPNSYIRFIERSVDEVDMEVEYDMDEEDIAWLELINEQRTNSNVTHVSVDVFELLMDRLEKESYFQMQILGKSGEDTGLPFIDEDAVCCICMDGECQNSNVILFCDMCNLAVHQDCYGVPYIPEGQWMCRRCLQSPSRTVDCVLCPNNGGAFKQTDRGHWAHVVCALWIPEVRFANTVFLEPIDSIEMIPPARWKLTCYICKQRGVGACIQCHKNNCYAAFHVTCAQHAGLYMKMETVQDPRAKDPAQIMVQKTAFCDTHTPADAEVRPHISNLKARLLPQAPASLISSQDIDQKNSITDLKDKELKEIEGKRSVGGGGVENVGVTPKSEHMVKEKGKKDTGEKSNDTSVGEVDQKLKLKSARKSDTKKPNAVPVISIPTIPPDRIQDIASLANIPKKNQFMQRLVAYWTLKRRMRNGVPLLRRLQNNHLSRKEDSRPLQEGEMYKQLKYWQRLRQDLERVRLLCELVRKREKLKNELCKTKERCLKMELQSFIYFLRTLHDLIRAKDVGAIFLEPVDQTEVLDYADVVKHPMDLSTMRKKIDDFRYSNLDDYIADFNLMIDNCMSYNARDTVFYKAAAKMRDQCNPIFIQARKDMEASGFNMATGMLITDRTPVSPSDNNIPEDDGRSSPPPMSQSPPPASPPSPTLEEVMRKDIDDEIALVLDKSNDMPNSKRLNKLLSLLNRIDKMKSGVARSFRQRRIKTEVRNLRRAMAMSRSVARRRRVVPKRPILVKEKSESDSEREDSSDDDKPLIRLPRQPPATTVSTSKSTETPQPVVQASRQSSRRSISTTPAERSNLPSKSDVTTPKTDTEPQKEAVTRSTGKRGRPKKLSIDKMTESANVSKSDLPSDIDLHSSTPLGVKEQKLASSSLNSSKDLSSEPPMQLSSLPSGVNRRTAVLFTRKAKAAAAFKKPEKMDMHLDKSLGTSTPISTGRRRVGRPRKNPLPGISSAQLTSDTSLASTPGGDLSTLPISASFQVYRNQTDISVNTDTDTDDDEKQSKCSLYSSSTDETSDTCYSGGENSSSDYMHNSAYYSSAEDSRDGSPGQTVDSMEPLELVWAKCRGYPWYPALIIDPKMPRAGYLHNGVPIPAPPLDVLALGANYNEPVYLVLFFDNKRTWQWLPRNKLERLGVDRDVDREKLFQSRKPADRKAVKKAFDEAMAHNKQVSGSNRQEGNSDESMSEEPFDPEDI